MSSLILHEGDELLLSAVLSMHRTLREYESVLEEFDSRFPQEPGTTIGLHAIRLVNDEIEYEGDAYDREGFERYVQQCVYDLQVSKGWHQIYDQETKVVQARAMLAGGGPDIWLVHTPRIYSDRTELIGAWGGDTVLYTLNRSIPYTVDVMGLSYATD